MSSAQGQTWGPPEEVLLTTVIPCKQIGINGTRMGHIVCSDASSHLERAGASTACGNACSGPTLAVVRLPHQLTMMPNFGICLSASSFAFCDDHQFRVGRPIKNPSSSSFSGRTPGRLQLAAPSLAFCSANHGRHSHRLQLPAVPVRAPPYASCSMQSSQLRAPPLAQPAPHLEALPLLSINLRCSSGACGCLSSLQHARASL